MKRIFFALILIFIGGLIGLVIALNIAIYQNHKTQRKIAASEIAHNLKVLSAINNDDIASCRLLLDTDLDGEVVSFWSLTKDTELSSDELRLIALLQSYRQLHTNASSVSLNTVYSEIFGRAIGGSPAHRTNRCDRTNHLTDKDM